VSDLYDVHFVRSVSLVIWRIERYVCFWPFWFSKPTISSTVITFSSVRVCFSLPVSCRWSVLLHVFKINLINTPCFPCCSLSSKILPLFYENYFFNWSKFLIRAFSPLLNGTLRHRYIVVALKIIIYDNIVCFCLQTSEMNVKLKRV